MTTIVLFCTVFAAFIGHQWIKILLMKRYRTSLRPHVERLVIEKRWMERAARFRREYEDRWNKELRERYFEHVAPVARRIFRFQDFVWALDAEFAGLTNREIASWTFIDRVSDSRAGFENVVSRCLERDGWCITPLHGGERVDLHMVLSSGGRRIGVYCHYGAQSPECLSVSDAATGGRRQDCDAVYLITNGRFSGAVTAFAELQGITLLHCSQLDRIEAQALRSGRLRNLERRSRASGRLRRAPPEFRPIPRKRMPA